MQIMNANEVKLVSEFIRWVKKRQDSCQEEEVGRKRGVKTIFFS